MKKLTSILLVVTFTAGAALCAESSLPVNRWTRATEKDLGVRNDAAVVWLAREKRFLVLCGLIAASKGSAGKPYEIQTFDPKTRKWQNLFPAGKERAWDAGAGVSKAPGFRSVGTQYTYICARDRQKNLRLEPLTGIGKYSAYDPERRRVYVCLSGHRFHNDLARKRVPLFCYDVDKRAWQLLGDAPPAVEKGSVYGEVKMSGAAMVFDAVNQELLFLGGHCSGAERGSVGNWAFNVTSKAWKRITSPSKDLDPLRERVLASKDKCRDALAAARNVFCECLPPAEEVREVKAGAGKLMTGALEGGRKALAAIRACKVNSWRGKALARAGALAEKAVNSLAIAASAFSAGRVDAKLLKGATDASWALDEAADMLRSSPGPRMGASAAYDPASKSVVLFGGEHGDYLLSDTWIYDCAKRSWRQVFPEKSPAARTGASMFWLPGRKALCLSGGGAYGRKYVYFRRSYAPLKDVWAFDPAKTEWTAAGRPEMVSGKKAAAPVIKSTLAAGDGDVIIGLAVQGRYARRGFLASTWLLRVGAPDAALTAKLGVPGGSRSYLKDAVKEYDPCWYDAAPRGRPAEHEKFLAGVRPNTWTKVPAPKRCTPRRNWGTMQLDPSGDQLFIWTGGHLADPSTLVHHYHLGTNRFSIGYAAEYLAKGNSFNGRPDCMNHVYLNWAYDVVTKRAVMSTKGGVGLYSPARRDYDYVTPQPFGISHYTVNAEGTPHGVVFWTPSYFGLFDAQKKTWKKLPMTGDKPSFRLGPDDSSLTYDPKRDCLWMMTNSGHSKVNGQVWRYDMKTGALKAMNPKNMNTLGVGRGGAIREAVIIPELDLLLLTGFVGPGGKFTKKMTDFQVAYDLARNRYVATSVRRGFGDVGGVGPGYAYDAKRKLTWASVHGRVYVLRIDPKTLKISEDPGKL